MNGQATDGIADGAAPYSRPIRSAVEYDFF